MKLLKKEKVKRYLRRGAAALMCAATILPMTMIRSEALDSAEILSKVDLKGKIYLFKWTPLMDGDYARPGSNYLTMLNEKSKVIRGIDQVHSGPDEAQIYVRANYTPFSYGARSSSDIFYTLGSMGAPIVSRKGDDSDNNGYQHVFWLADEEYPYAPRQSIDRNGDGDWDEFANFNRVDLKNDSRYSSYIDDFCQYLSNPYYSKWREIDPGQYEDPSFFTLCKVQDGGKFMIFKNISNARDPAWQCYSNGRIWCDQESDDGDRCWFNVWYGDPTVYSVLKQSYSIGDGQTLTLDSTATAYRGIYIPPTATLTVSKGGTLAINETVFNDGTIVCDGGTLIIQDRGMLSPLGEDGKSGYYSNGKNKIVVQNGGTIIIMKGGRVYTTQAYPMTLINSRLINFGDYVMGGDMELYSSFVENRKGGRILCGLNYTSNRDDMRATFQDAYITDNSCTNMGSGYAAKFKIYDTKDHYEDYGWYSNEGVIKWSGDPYVFNAVTNLQTTLETAKNNIKNLMK